jgi:hypothetical protein
LLSELFLSLHVLQSSFEKGERLVQATNNNVVEFLVKNKESDGSVLVKALKVGIVPEATLFRIKIPMEGLFREALDVFQSVPREEQRKV